MADAETEARLKKIETTLDRLAAKLAELEARVTSPGQEAEVVKVLRQRVDAVTGERDTLAQDVARLQTARVTPTAELIGQSFAGATQKLREGLGSGFAVSDMTVEMKSQLAVGSDGALRFVLPQPGEAIAADTLSTVRFSLRSGVAAAAPESPLIPVPSLIGLPREAALLLLTRAGLKPGTETPQAARARPGTVLAQSPLPGDEIAAEIAVDLTIAAPPPVEVPDLTGLAAVEAGKRLADAGLATGRVSDAPRSTGVAAGTPGTVASQSARPGTMLPPGTAIDLQLVPPPPPPQPAPTVRVPDLTGRPAAEATATLATAGLTAGPTRHLASSKPNDTVLAVDPKPGTELPRSAPVALTLARKRTVTQLTEALARRTPTDTLPTAAAGRGTAAVPSSRMVEQLRALNLRTPEDMVALSNEPDAVLATKLGLPTPRDAAAARALLRSVLEG